LTEVYFQRRGFVLPLFHPSCVKSVVRESRAWHFKDWGVVFSSVLSVLRWSSFWILLIKGIQSEKKLNVTSWSRVRCLSVRPLIHSFDCLSVHPSNYSGLLPYDVRWWVWLRTAAAPSLLLTVVVLGDSRLHLTLALCGHRYSSGSLLIAVIVLHEDQVKIRKDFWCYHVSPLHQSGFSSAESYLASTTFVIHDSKDSCAFKCSNLEVKKKSPLIGAGELKLKRETIHSIHESSVQCLRCVLSQSLIERTKFYWERCLLFIEKGPRHFRDIWCPSPFPFY